MAIESKNLLVWVKSMSRGQALPLDASEVWESLADAQAYATGLVDSSSVAYVGQTLKVKNEGSVDVYIISDTTGTLTKLADAQAVTDAIEAIPEIEAISDEEIVALVAEVFGEGAA